MSTERENTPGDASNSDNPHVPFPAFDQQQDGSPDSPQDSILALESVKESVRDFPISDDTDCSDDLDVLSSRCQLCMKYGALKNKVRKTTPEERHTFRNVKLEDDGDVWIPFASQPSSHNTQQTTSASFPLVCQRCVRLFRRFARAENDTRVSAKRAKEVGVEKRRFMDRRKKTLNEFQGTTNVDTRCFMADKGTLACSASPDNIYRPTRVKMESKAVKEMLCELLAKRNNVTVSVVQKIVLHPEEVRLCNVHTGVLGSCLLKIKKAARVCSVCNQSGSVRHPREVTRFPWKRISGDEDLVCIVEDALAVFKGTNLRPSDITFICDSCRRVVCRDIDMRFNVARDQLQTNQRNGKKRIDYGPTPLAIRRCIKFVRSDLEKKGNYVVFLKTIRTEYESYLPKTGEEARRLKDDRSLKKYVQPSLAATGIHLMLGPFKLGSFFCTTSKFVELAALAKKPSYAPLAMTPDVEGGLYDQFGQYVKEKESLISKSTWRLCDFIRAVPRLLWWREVELLWGPQLKKRCHSIAALRDTSYEEQWPCNPLLCPNDLRSLPNHEFTFTVSVYFSIERTVFLRSRRRVRGPINASLSLVSLTNTSVSYLTLLNRIGCAASYQTLDSWRASAIDERKRIGPFQELEPGALVAVGIDNVNLRALHSLNVCGITYFGFDGLAMQAVNPNPYYNFESYCDRLALLEPHKLMPKEISSSKPLSSSRLEFIEEMFPSRKTDPDIVGFKWLAVGMAAVNESRIATEDQDRRKSFRRVLMDGVKGSSNGKARVEYVDVRGCNANDEFEIIRLLESIEDHFNPFNSERMILICVVGDQPIFKILFKLWATSLVKKTKLARWMIPIPGGFHIDKQGILSMLKIFLSGSGFEEAMPFSGLPKKKQESIVSYGHYRKNRRVMSQYTAALVLRLIEVVTGYDPDVRDAITRLKLKVQQELELAPSEGEKLYKSERRRNDIISAMPKGCELAVCEKVSPQTIEIGRKVVESVQAMAVDSVNMKFYGEVQVLDMLLPWNAYNILTRKGLTRLVDKFWLSFVGLLHGTNKLNYQENILMYGVVKAAMPEAMKHVLYDMGQLVISLHETSTEGALAQDDCVETKIIRDTKRMNTNDPKTIESSPPIATAIGHAQDSIDKELLPASRPKMIEDENHAIPDTKKRDREARTATNVVKMLRFLRDRRWLGEEHRRSPQVINVLRDPWFVVESTAFFDQYVKAEESGRLAASLHLGTKFYELFPCLTPFELKTYFENKTLKQVQNRWTTKFAIKTMAYMDVSQPKVGSKRGRAAKDRMQNRMTKRMKRIFGVKETLSKVLDTYSGISLAKKTVDDARAMLKDVEGHDHVLCSKSYAYRSSLSSDDPFRARDSFLSELQSSLSKRCSRADFGFLSRDLMPQVPPVFATHLDITSEVNMSPSLRMQRTTIGEAVFDKVEQLIKPFVMSSRYQRMRDFHIHVNVSGWKPLQYPSKRSANNFTAGIVDDVDVYDEEGNIANDICQTWTLMKETWSSLLSNPRNYEFLKSLHAVSAAKAAILLRMQAENQHANDEEELVFNGDKLTVFLHGIQIAITKEAQRSSINELEFLRMDDQILVSRKSESATGPCTVFDLRSHCMELDNYGPECCWKVSEFGFQRYERGDCAHGESQTRIVHTIEQVTALRLANNEIASDECSILVRSCQTESPFITALSSPLQQFNIFHQLEECVVNVKAMRKAVMDQKVRLQDVVLLYAMSGSSLSPSTQQITQQQYVSAFFSAEFACSSLYNMEILNFPSRGNLHWLKFQELVAGAYMMKYRKTVGQGAILLPDRLGRSGDGSELSDSERREWVCGVQKWVAVHGDVVNPIQLMPDTKDIELQARRAVWILKYWESANNYACHRESMGDLKPEFGYKNNGEVLFELPEDVLDREEILKKVVKTCICKKGCKNSRCSCLKRGLSCVLCACENCENRTKLTLEEVAKLRNAQEQNRTDSEEEPDDIIDFSEEEESDDDSVLQG